MWPGWGRWRCGDIPIIPSVFPRLQDTSARHLPPGAEGVHVVRRRPHGAHDGASPAQRGQGLGIGWTKQKDCPRDETEQHGQQAHHEVASSTDGCSAIHVEQVPSVEHADMRRCFLGIGPGVQAFMQRPQQQSQCHACQYPRLLPHVGLKEFILQVERGQYGQVDRRASRMAFSQKCRWGIISGRASAGSGWRGAGTMRRVNPCQIIFAIIIYRYNKKGLRLLRRST